MQHTMQDALHNKNMEKIRLISGSSNAELAILISKRLNIKLVDMKITDFANTEIGVVINEVIRNHHIYIVQTGGAYGSKSINDHLMELYALIHACVLSSAKSVNVIMPCYAYARSDKKDGTRSSIMGSCQANILQSLGVKRIISMDLHAGQIQGFFTKIPMDNLYGINLHIENLKKTVFLNMTQEEINEKFVLAAPDEGATKRIEIYANKMGMKHVLMHKHRNYDIPGVVLNTILVGAQDAVKGKTVIVIDDMFDTFGTINSAATELVSMGAKSVIAASTHGILSGQAIDKINENKFIEKVIVTNTLPQTENLKKTQKLQVIDTSELFAETIFRLQTGAGLSGLFS